MAGKPKPMSIVKQILLLINQGHSKKSIVRQTGVSKNTVRHYNEAAQGSGHSFEELIKMEDPVLESVLNKQTSVNRAHFDDLFELFPYMQEELKRTGVNRFVLWGEYRQRYPDGYSYSQFCWHYQQWERSQKVSMVMEHEPGDKIFIDFAGKKLHYHDLQSGKDVEVEFFAAILGHSQLSFACALESQKSEDFLLGCRRMLEYFRGSTKAIVVDNLKAGVSKASRYEPQVTQSFSDFCNHYQTAALPARVAKPKDKSLVEGLVRILYSRIYAPLRHQMFYSLNEINLAIARLLEVHNNTVFTHRPESRRQLFERFEKQMLQPLPLQPFEFKFYCKATVQKNSHIVLGEDKHYYSVPMRFIGQEVKVIYTAQEVNIFCQGQRVAYHKRTRTPGKYTYLSEHLPSSHSYMLGLTPEKFIEWGKTVSDTVELYITKLFESKKHPELAYKSCQGIQSLARKLGKDKLIKACQTGLELQVYNYMFIKNVMENNHDRTDPLSLTLPFHENIRGPQAYQ